MMGTCAGLMGPKSENVEKGLVLPLLFEGSRGPGAPQECKQVAEKYRLGGGCGLDGAKKRKC